MAGVVVVGSVRFEAYCRHRGGKDPAVVLQSLEVSESTLDRWRAKYGGMKCEEAKRLKHLENENRRLKQLVADQALDIQMLKHLSEGNW